MYICNYYAVVVIEVRREMRVSIEGTELRAKKDEKPVLHKGWVEVSILVNDEESVGFRASDGHWLYFEHDEIWYKVDYTPQGDEEIISISTLAPKAKRTEEEKKAARRARQEKRREARKEAKLNLGNINAVRHFAAEGEE